MFICEAVILTSELLFTRDKIVFFPQSELINETAPMKRIIITVKSSPIYFIFLLIILYPY